MIAPGGEPLPPLTRRLSRGLVGFGGRALGGTLGGRPALPVGGAGPYRGAPRPNALGLGTGRGERMGRGRRVRGGTGGLALGSGAIGAGPSYAGHPRGFPPMLIRCKALE